MGLYSLFLKDEGRNPTGAYKDRGTSVGMTVAVERGPGLWGRFLMKIWGVPRLLMPPGPD